MDMKSKRCRAKMNKKWPPLKATAAAVIALNAGVVTAATCPLVISSSIASVCSFSTNASVTVANGGTVQGIEASGYDAGSNSFIAVNAGGLITGTSSTGIRFLSSMLSGSISNSGSIHGDNNGISLGDSAVVTGGISNSGEITANSTGVSVNSSTVSGGISNSGSISASRSGIYIEESTISGGILNSGLIAGAFGVSVSSSTVSGGISNSGVINAGSSNGQSIAVYSSTVANGISNSGSISGATGIFVGSSATINGTISNSGTIHGSTSAITVESNSSVSGIDIVGTSSRIIGTVDASGSTVNITTGADFTSEGEFTVDAFNIASGAIFHMANTINTATLVDNSGTLSVASGTQQQIAGNYTQSASGVYQMGATSTQNYGQLMSNGAVDLSASGAINVQVQPGASFKNGDVLTNVMQGNTFTAPINGYTVTNNSYLWTFTGSSNGTNGVDLSIGVKSEGGSACKGKYCQGAADVIFQQITAGNAAFNPYGIVPTAEAFATAASQATPELTNENLQVTQLVSRTVIDVLPMWSSLRGASTGDAMIYQPGKVWLKPYGASMTQNQRNTVNGYTASVYGLVAGSDIQVADHWMLGGALAAGGDNIRGKSVLSGQSIDSAQYQGLIYTSRLFANNAYFAAQGLLGYGDNDTKRSIPLYASTAKANYNSWFTDLSAELGWSHPLTDRFMFIPAVNASYLYINQGGYTETGSLMDLNVRSNNNSSLVLGADANVAYRATTLKNQQDLTLTGHAGVAYDVINSQPSTISTFVAGGPGFSTYGIQYNDAVFRGGLGLTLANPTKPLSVNLNADLQTGNNGYSGIYSATLKYKI